MSRNFFQLILEVNSLESTLAQYNLIELFLIDGPYLFKTFFEMMSKLFVDF